MKPDDRRFADDLDALRALHREASTHTDDAPDPAVRAAVLAAAARAVAATPQAASRPPPARRRWAIAAIVVASVAIGVVGERAWRAPSQADVVATADVAMSSPAVDPAPRAKVAAPAEPAAHAADAAPTRATAPAARAPASGNAKSAGPPSPMPPPMPSMAGSRTPSPAPAPQSAAVATPPSAPPPAAETSRRIETPRSEPSDDAPPAGARDAADTAARKAAGTPATAVSRAAPRQALQAERGADPRPDGREAATDRAPSGGLERSPDISANLETSPVAWAGRIAALRAAGRDDEADRELAALRRRYPAFEVPPAAQRAPGVP